MKFLGKAFKHGVVVTESSKLPVDENSALKFMGILETAQGSGDEGREGGK